MSDRGFRRALVPLAIFVVFGALTIYGSAFVKGAASTAILGYVIFGSLVRAVRNEKRSAISELFICFGLSVLGLLALLDYAKGSFATQLVGLPLGAALVAVRELWARARPADSPPVAS